MVFEFIMTIVMTVILGGCVLLVYYQPVRVRSGHKVIMLHSARAPRVLEKGHHLIYPFEEQLRFSWSYLAEGGTTEWLRGDQIPINELYMNLEPISTVTMDDGNVWVNGMLTYQIVDVLAVTCLDNPLALLRSEAISATTSILAGYGKNHVHKNKNDIEEAIVKQINQHMKKHGVRCNRYAIECIRVDVPLQWTTQPMTVMPHRS